MANFAHPLRMIKRLFCFGYIFATCLVNPAPANAQEADFGLASPEVLEEVGFLRFLIPRFSLKTGIRVALQANNPEVIISTERGLPMMEGMGQVFYLQITDSNSSRGDKARRFAAWIDSEIGHRTIEQFTSDDVTVFVAIDSLQAAEAAPVFSGDAQRGEAFSYANCGRCHVIGDRNRMKGIGSTPSFPVLLALADWEERFSTFYTRIPHPSIAQLEGVSPPFDPAFPPANAALRLTLDDLEDILTYVSTLPPADLGAPLIEH